MNPIRPFEIDPRGALLRTDLALPRRSGKVRDVYDLGETLMVVTTDRISAFDWVLPTGIPERGRLLTAMSEFWFGRLGVPHHLLGTEVPEGVLPADVDPEPLRGRVMIVKKAEVIPFECVVRGYLEGSGWREYQATGAVCGVRLPEGLRQCERLPEPIFTPATKAETGHDENVSADVMAAALGGELTERLRRMSLDVYRSAAGYARQRGILIADTKFEWGRIGEEVLLIDEVLTPDSSRFWPADRYEPGGAQRSFDKQFVREWLAGTDWDRDSPPPPLPEEIVAKTREKYVEVYERLTGGC